MNAATATTDRAATITDIVRSLTGSLHKMTAETAVHLGRDVQPHTAEGACLGTSAILARVLADHGITTTLIRGEYDEHAHWWLHAGPLRIDATRDQFDARPLVEYCDDEADETPYCSDRQFPVRWTDDQAVAEFARMFELPDVGAEAGRAILAELSDCADAMTGVPLPA